VLIERPNQVWATDITYIPMAHGWVYLCAIVDWASRRVLAHRVWISMEADFGVLALEEVEEAMLKYGPPEIFNSDQGSQFTSDAFTAPLLAQGVQISMDGRGAWRDNVFVERLWRTIKYEEVYLHAYEFVSDAKAALARYIAFYNSDRPHSSLDKKTPDEFYFATPSQRHRNKGLRPKRRWNHEYIGSTGAPPEAWRGLTLGLR